MNPTGFPRYFGPFVLLRPLARGGMGALYLALRGERGMEKLCVVKTALPHPGDKGYLQRFRDEAKIVVRLSHGNLVTVFDAGQIQGELFLAMDFIEGKDLRAVWNRCAQKGVAFPVPVAAHIARELARGLAYAHAFEGLSLVHRDVSPPNVLLSYSGEVKLTDFGLASSTLKLEKTAPGIIYGKVSYMAPEQARGEGLDGRGDLYAAGVILWELLTGRQLFPPSQKLLSAGNADEDLLQRVRQPAVAPPSTRSMRVPPELDRIVLKALAPLPAQRYQSGEDLRADLAAFLAKTSPSTDGAEVAAFLAHLFHDEIAHEQAERHRLVQGASLLLPTARPVGSEERTPRVTPVARPSRPAPPTPPVDDDGTTGQMHAKGKDDLSQILGGVLAGRYRILRLVGEGGMGKVYEAEHTEIGKRVAVKVMHTAYARSPEVVERFRREARAASKVNHPNIVNVTDSGTTADGAFFFVMEYISGVELGLTIHEEGPMPVLRMLHIAAQMCDALDAAHAAGIIHRDLKPENVLLVASDERKDLVKVLDFGIAKNAEVEEAQATGRRLTRPGVAMGTPEYMAPEQAAGKPADARSDIYAVGSILYEMMTGQPPYDGENVMEVLHKKATQDPRPLAEARPDVPPDVVAVVESAMARHPKDRPQSMRELGDRVRAIAAAIEADPTAAATYQRHESPALSGAIDPSIGLKAFGATRKMLIGGAAALAIVAIFAIVRASVGRPRVVPAPAPVAAARPPAPPSASEPEPVTPTSAAAPEPSEAPAGVAPIEIRATGARGAAAVAPTPAAIDGRKLVDEGRKLLKAQRYDEARRTLERALSSRARGPALVGLAEIAFQEKKYEEAIASAKQGARLGGGAGARVVLGDAYFKLERYAEARDAYAEALKLDPDNAIARRNLDLAARRLP